jgi:hypothetical protein
MLEREISLPGTTAAPEPTTVAPWGMVSILMPSRVIRQMSSSTPLDISTLIRALLQLYSYYGDDFKVEYPTGSGEEKTLFEITQCISECLISIFTKDENGRRPVYGGAEKFQTDPHWQDLILFYEYFHGDDGSGIGASHQTG